MALIRYNDSEFGRFHGGGNLPGFKAFVHAQLATEGYTSSTGGRQYCWYHCRTTILQVLLANGNAASIKGGDEWTFHDSCFE